MKTILPLCLLAAASFSQGQAAPVSDEAIRDAFGGRQAALVLLDTSSGARTAFPKAAAAEMLPPCSTFKIVNALIGLELGILSSPDEPFYKWDGQKRSIEAWNRDLTLKEAFQASCVPAFQILARKIGPARMQAWIDKIGYGNRDTSAGIDVFWLPAKNRKTIIISASEQADLMQKIASGKVPFSDKSLAVLKELMRVKSTDRGILYGKTGSGTDEHGAFNLGWFVGYVESHGKTYAFACVAQGKNVMSKDARQIVEAVLTKQGLL